MTLTMRKALEFLLEQNNEKCYAENIVLYIKCIKIETNLSVIGLTLLDPNIYQQVYFKTNQQK